MASGDFPALVSPWTRYPLVHEDTDLLPAPTMDALDARYEPLGGGGGGEVPTGGTAGQILTKDSGTDFDTSWQDAAGGEPDASTTVKGIVELATDAEATTGTDTTRAVTPSGLAAAIAAAPPAIPHGSVASVISEQHVNNVAGAHTYTSISCAVGDMLLLFATGGWSMYNVSTPPNGWKVVADTGTSSSTIECTVLAKIATSTSETVSFNFTTNDPVNFSSLVVLRGPIRVERRAIQGFGGTSNSTAWTFATDYSPSVTGAVGFPYDYQKLDALMFFAGSDSTKTVTPTPSATSTIFNLTGLSSSRHAHLWRTNPATSYSATISGAEYKAGIIIHLG